MQEDMWPANTQKAMDPKVKEYFCYCDLVYPSDPFKYTLEYMKVYKFMCYQAIWEQKPQGGKVTSGDGEYFHLEVYNEHIWVSLMVMILTLQMQSTTTHVLRSQLEE